MSRRKLLTVASVTTVVAALVALAAVHVSANDTPDPQPLPEAREEMRMPLEKALSTRRSVRRYTDEPLTAKHIAALCWAAQGITEPQRGYRTAPSAGALYPLELYVVRPEGVARYIPERNALQPHASGDVRSRLSAAALNQPWVRNAPAVFVFAGVFDRTQGKYGERGRRYVWMEAGHAAQNLLLAATAMDLAAVPVGAFRDEQVAGILTLPEDHRPLYILPVGHPSDDHDM
ncbi:MAG: SagB/ThcOx family dehydrogenase [Phycisphaerae bacterium]